MMDTALPGPCLILGAGRRIRQQERACFSRKLSNLGEAPTLAALSRALLREAGNRGAWGKFVSLDRILAMGSEGNFLLCEIKTRVTSLLLVHPSSPSGLSAVPPGARWGLV